LCLSVLFLGLFFSDKYTRSYGVWKNARLIKIDRSSGYRTLVYYILHGSNKLSKSVAVKVNFEGAERHKNSVGFSYYEYKLLGYSFRVPNDPNHGISNNYLIYFFSIFAGFLIGVFINKKKKTEAYLAANKKR